VADCTTAAGYGRFLYGRNRYGGWPGGAGRPYGVGAYSAGAYARYGANIFCMGGSSGVVFDARIAQPALKFSLAAASSITFLPRIDGFSRVFNAQAVTQIVFHMHADWTLAWADTAPCMTGGWTPAVPCSTGAWTVVGACGVGAWNGTELVR